VRLILSSLLLLTLFRCGQGNGNASALIVGGTWKTDSVYSYYNGFTSTKYDLEEEPMRSYAADGKLVMTRGSESRTFLYSITDSDSLLHKRSDSTLMEKFRILKIDGKRLVLRKELPPIFPGEGQERYLVIYSSRTEK